MAEIAEFSTGPPRHRGTRYICCQSHSMFSGSRPWMNRSFSIIAAAIVVALLVTLLGAIRTDPMVLTASVAALLGGIVLFGSNTATSKQAAAKMKEADARRAELIDGLELQVVDGVER